MVETDVAQLRLINRFLAHSDKDDTWPASNHQMAALVSKVLPDGISGFVRTRGPAVFTGIGPIISGRERPGTVETAI